MIHLEKLTYEAFMMDIAGAAAAGYGRCFLYCDMICCGKHFVRGKIFLSVADLNSEAYQWMSPEKPGPEERSSGG